jgi:hypothetical protein
MKLSREAIAKINAVEGIPLEDTARTFALIDRWTSEGLTDDEQIARFVAMLKAGQDPYKETDDEAA